MEQPKRKPNRLSDFDYSQSGAYFITVCTKEKSKILCNIVGGGVLDAPECTLSEKGKVVEKYINSINNVDYARVDKYTIMPNHIHMIIMLKDSFGTSKTPSPTNAKIPHLISMFKRFCNRELGEDIFQRSYYDHIIRDEKDYLVRWNYIDTNPAKWWEDEYF